MAGEESKRESRRVIKAETGRPLSLTLDPIRASNRCSPFLIPLGRINPTAGRYGSEKRRPPRPEADYFSRNFLTLKVSILKPGPMVVDTAMAFR